VTTNMTGSDIIEESQCSPDMRISTQILGIYLSGPTTKNYSYVLW
jgi:hypothetical protein